MKAGDLACMDCGRRFRTVAAAERASFGPDGCPDCGGSDIQELSAEEAKRFNLRRELKAAEDASAKAAAARAALPAGSSRARVTSANARWARLAEHRDRIRNQIDKMEIAS